MNWNEKKRLELDLTKVINDWFKRNNPLLNNSGKIKKAECICGNNTFAKKDKMLSGTEVIFDNLIIYLPLRKTPPFMARI